MSVLLLRLTGPMQAWGDRSRFVRRETATEPTKSGIVGLLAAAQGRRRTDPVEDLAALQFGVRVDQPGSLLRDFQTARSLDGTRVMPLSTRYYLSDAVFLAAVEGDDSLIDGLATALRNPTFPLYLGRRSCPPAEPVAAMDAVRSGHVAEVLIREPWRAADWYQRKASAGHIAATIVLDEAAAHVADDGPEVGTLIVNRELPRIVRDLPVSFDPSLREYGFRTVIRGAVMLENPFHVPRSGTVVHDVMSELGG